MELSSSPNSRKILHSKYLFSDQNWFGFEPKNILQAESQNFLAQVLAKPES